MDNILEKVVEKVDEKVEEKVVEKVVEKVEEKVVIIEDVIPLPCEFDTLVLSGGSIQGISILGGLQYLKDNNMINNIQNYVGTSVGSIICYLLVIGYTPIEIVVYLCINGHLFEKLKCFDVVSAAKGEGATTFLHISDQLEKMTIEKIGRLITMKEIQTIFGKKLTCITYNITKSTTEYLDCEKTPDLPCLIALRMSSNLPLIFETFRYGDSFYVDGGLSNNFAVDVGETQGKKVLAMCLDFNIGEDNPHINFVEYVYKLLLIPTHQSTQYKINNKSESTTILQLQCGNIKFFNFDISSKTKLELFSKGYEDVKIYFNA